MKIYKSLKKKYRVLALGWNRDYPVRANLDDVVEKDVRLFRLKAPVGSYLIIFYLPFFWVWVITHLFWYRPKVVHGCDLDSVLPCIIYSKVLRKKVIFDIRDRYGMAYVSPRLGVLQSTINIFEETCCKKADRVVACSKTLVKSLKVIPKSITIILNCSPIEDFKKEKNWSSIKQRDKFTIVYAGNIAKDRGLLETANSIQGINDVEFLVAGKPMDKGLLNKLLTFSNIKYCGLLQHDASLRLISNSDAMIILYDPTVPNNNFSMSTKLFEAMRCGIPIITNVATELVKNEVNCGLIVKYDNLNEIRSAIVELRDDVELREKLGRKGHEAFLKKYNWNMVEEELFTLYKSLPLQNLECG